MFDDLRQQVNEGQEEEPEEDDFYAEEVAPRRSNLLGMTAAQRFAISLMLMVMTCILGAFFLMVTDRFGLAF